MTSLFTFDDEMYKRFKNPSMKKKSNDASTHEKKRNLLLYNLQAYNLIYHFTTNEHRLFQGQIFIASNYNRFKIPYLKVYQLLF